MVRWFTFTLKPPDTVVHGNLLLAISDTSHWTFFVKFGLKTAWDISYDILWLILKYVNFWLLQGHSSTSGKIIGLQKINLFSMKKWRGLGVLGGQVPRLYSGTFFWGMWHTWGIRRGIEHKGSIFWHICDSSEGTQHWLIWSRISPQVWTRVLYIPWFGFLNTSPIGHILGLQVLIFQNFWYFEKVLKF